MNEKYLARNARHGSPVNDMNSRHVGDLGNVTANSEGVANFKITDKLIKVWDIIGRSVVVAEGRDDYGLGGHPKSEVR